MRTIKIFVASSYEMAYERDLITSLANEFNYLLVDSSVRVHISKWEHLDPSLKLIRKQEEYNQTLEQCSAVIVMFHQRVGKFTREEFERAKYTVKSGSNTTNRIKVCFVDEVYRSLEITDEERSHDDYISAADYERQLMADNDDVVDLSHYGSTSELIADVKQLIIDECKRYELDISCDESGKLSLQSVIEAKSPRQITVLYVPQETLSEERVNINDFFHHYNKVAIESNGEIEEIYITDKVENLTKCSCLVMLAGAGDDLERDRFMAVFDRGYQVLTCNNCGNTYVFLKQPFKNMAAMNEIYSCIHDKYTHYCSQFGNAEKIKYEMLINFLSKIKNTYSLEGPYVRVGDSIVCDLERADLSMGDNFEEWLKHRNELVAKHRELLERGGGDPNDVDLVEIQNSIKAIDIKIEERERSAFNSIIMWLDKKSSDITSQNLEIEEAIRRCDFKRAEALMNMVDSLRPTLSDDTMASRERVWAAEIDFFVKWVVVTCAISDDPSRRQSAIKERINRTYEWIESEGCSNRQAMIPFYKYVIEFYADSYDESDKESIEQSIDYLKATKCREFLDYLRYVGNYYWRSLNFEDAECAYNDVVRKCKKSITQCDPADREYLMTVLAETYNDTGLLSFDCDNESQNLARAQEMFNEALKIYTEIKASESTSPRQRDRVAATYSNMGRMYCSVEPLYNFEMSYGLLQKAIAIREQERLLQPNAVYQNSALAFPLTNLAVLLLKRAEEDTERNDTYLQEALLSIDRAIDCIKLCANTQRYYRILMLKAQILNAMCDYESAKQNLIFAINIAEGTAIVSQTKELYRVAMSLFRSHFGAKSIDDVRALCNSAMFIDYITDNDLIYE